MQRNTDNHASGNRVPQVTPISELFEDQLHTDLFNARCHDTGEATTRKYTIISKEDIRRLTFAL